MTCTKCKSGYWLNPAAPTKCELGYIKNCDEYGTGIYDCKKCLPNYWNFASDSS